MNVEIFIICASDKARKNYLSYNVYVPTSKRTRRILIKCGIENFYANNIRILFQNTSMYIDHT